MEKSASAAHSAAHAEFVETMGLRRAAKNLSKTKNGNDYERLLSLLRGGKLTAGFQVVDPIQVWINIPSAYWSEVATSEFRSIKIKNGSKQFKGEYRVKLRQFATEFVASWLHVVGNSASANLQFANILKNSDREYEVAIPLRSWDRYLSETGLPVSSGEPPTLERVSWKGIIPYIVEYFVVNGVQARDDEKRNAVAAGILELAAIGSLEKVPGKDYLEDVVSECFKRLKRAKSR